MDKKAKSIAAAAGGAFAGGVAMKMVKSPVTAVGVLGLGVYLASKGKTETAKAMGLGLTSIGAIGTAGKVAEKVTSLQKFTPSINGMGELYEDEYGNIIELDGLGNVPELVQDEYGNTYMVNGLEGEDDLDDLVGIDGDEYFDDYDDLDGFEGKDLEDLV